MGEDGLIKRAERAAEYQANAEATDNESMGFLDEYISNTISKEEHGIYFNQPYNAIADFDNDGEFELLTLVVYEDGNCELFINQTSAGIFSQDIEDISLSSDGTIISIEDIEFKLNAETHDLYLGEKYTILYTGSDGENTSVVSYVFYENGSCEIFNYEQLEETLPAGTCVYDGEKIVLGEDTAYISMDGTQIIMPGFAVFTSQNMIQFNRPYVAYISKAGAQKYTRTYIFREDGSAMSYRNGEFSSELPAGTFVYENDYIYYSYEGQLVQNFRGVQGGMSFMQLPISFGLYRLINESVAIQGSLRWNSIDEKDINNGVLTLPEYWIGDDGVKYLPDTIYLDITEREDIKCVVIPNSAGSVNINSQYVEEYRVDEDNENYTVVDGVLYNKDMTVLVRYPEGKKDTTFRIPDGVTSMGIYDSTRFLWSDENSYVTTLIIPRSFTGETANENDGGGVIQFPSLTTINYEGTEEEWENISWSSYYDWENININFEYTP